MVQSPTLKSAKSTAITGGEVLAGFLGAHAIRGAVKSEKKIVNAGAFVVSLLAHMSLKNEHAKAVALGMGTYFGVKTLNDLKSTAVAGLDGFDGLKEFLNSVVPGLGDTQIDLLSGDELENAERELLGLMANAEAEFTPYTEVNTSSIGSVSNL